MIRAIVVGIASALVVTAAPAQENYPTGPYLDEAAYEKDRWQNSTFLDGASQLGLVRGVELVLSDQADQGCWTNVEAVRAKARVELERSGIAVYEEPLAFHEVFFPSLTISVLATRAKDNGPCFGSVKMEVRYTVRDELGSLKTTGQVFRSYPDATLWSNGSVLINSRNLDEQTITNVEQYLDGFSGDVLAGRRQDTARKVLSVFTSDKPVTQAEFEAWNKESSE